MAVEVPMEPFSASDPLELLDMATLPFLGFDAAADGQRFLGPCRLVVVTVGADSDCRPSGYKPMSARGGSADGTRGAVKDCLM